MSSETECQRLKRLAERDVIAPVSRAFIPRDVLTDWEEMLGLRSDFFIVIPAGSDKVAIYAEGSAGYDQWNGVPVKALF